MAKVKFQIERCKGCGLCVEYCAKKIISLSDEMNSLGYNFPVVEDMELCNGCAICALMCPDVIIEVEGD
ncbi:2-oxoglutarate/2-oxoacid ferredoxin oxidoreductase, delta subunit [Candidatus Syntrophocurvum alkaliphilum]|uniref:2-oxoglutarate/2-oxoacid ferredoxin oxidoreductase, delta subunit n=1 Tax=Candidatus Syntrophocurvum alkaliphilum TaxID=2293317 RepID=A0A6I6DB49_9FIRM|nr:4Fe-4S dicluster domain-containing protein [Candidatus Syntrophocurvum alkaliphilum]QGT98724.1 2-oxoglutarate/2-oxoacid ferredoxin oxidoreductase, delta subunit [Candidatus Syntrophocurvum alkaliphilum]